MSRGSDAAGRVKPWQYLEGSIPNRRHLEGKAPAMHRAVEGQGGSWDWSKGIRGARMETDGGSANHDFFPQGNEGLKEEE